MPYQPAFDLDLNFGQQGEEWIRTLLDSQWKCKGCGGVQGCTVEIKRERDMWHSTGNLFFEFEWNGKPSGFKATKADWWIHILTLNGHNKGALIIPVSMLRVGLRKLVSEGVARVTPGGDYNAARGVLLPLGQFYKLFK
jgi:hypothetical protein